MEKLQLKFGDRFKSRSVNTRLYQTWIFYKIYYADEDTICYKTTHTLKNGTKMYGNGSCTTEFAERMMSSEHYIFLQ